MFTFATVELGGNAQIYTFGKLQTGLLHCIYCRVFLPSRLECLGEHESCVFMFGVKVSLVNN